MGLDPTIPIVLPYKGPILIGGVRIEGCKIAVNDSVYIVGHRDCRACSDSYDTQGECPSCGNTGKTNVILRIPNIDSAEGKDGTQSKSE